MTDPRPAFALVIPTLNEAGNIKTVLQRAVGALSAADVPWEILVVDDDSSDGTPDIAREFASSEPRVRVISRQGKRGLAGAITYGWGQTEATVVGVIDADLQHPPELLPALINGIREGADIAIASRYLNPTSMEGWNPLRRIVSKVGVVVGKRVEAPGLRVKDPLSGFFVFRRECIAGLDFQEAGFKLLLEILARGRIRSAIEIPFKFAVRTRGKSKANAMTAIHYLLLLMRLSSKKRGLREENPGP